MSRTVLFQSNDVAGSSIRLASFGNNRYAIINTRDEGTFADRVYVEVLKPTGS